MSKKINVNQTKFNALWKRHAPKARVTEPNAADLVALLVHSSLLYDATRKQADEATQRIRSSSVDWNEFRVNHVDDMVGIVGVRYPDAFARMKRLRMSLNDVYLRHHRVSLDMLVGKPKRDVRTYLENLEGMPAYVVARFMLLAMGVPLIPVDQALVDLLVDKGVLAEPADPVLVSEALAKVVRPDKAAEVHASLVVATDEFWTSGKALKVRKDREKLVEQEKKAAETQRAAAAAAALAALRAREEEAARAAAARPAPSAKAAQAKAASSAAGAVRKGALAERKGAGAPAAKAKVAGVHKTARSARPAKPAKAAKASRSPARPGRR